MRLRAVVRLMTGLVPGLVLLCGPGSAQAASPFAGGGTLRIAAGATADIKDDAGRVWSADRLGTGGRVVDHPGVRILTNGPQAAMYRHARVGIRRYEIPVPNGRYAVLLHFIENTEAIKGKGQRLFTVDVEGTKLGEVDVWDMAGGWNVPLVYSVPAVVKDGKLTVVFDNRRGDSIISGLEIQAAGAPVTAPVATGEQVIEDFSSLGGDTAKMAATCKSDERSGPARAALESGVGLPGDTAMRFDYAVNTTLPYSNRAYCTIPLSFELGTARSLQLWAKPDGTSRRFLLQLRTDKGQMTNIGFNMTGTEARLFKFPLDHMGVGGWFYTSARDPKLMGKLVSATFTVDAVGSLGGGSIYFGRLSASAEVVPPLTAPPGQGKAKLDNKWVMENFEGFKNDDELRESYLTTPHSNMTIFHLEKDPSHVGEGKQSMRVDYSFGKKVYSGFVLFQQMDLFEYNVFRLWIHPDGSGNRLRIFNASGGFFTLLLPLNDTKPQLVELPFADWLGYTADKIGNLEWGFWVSKVGASRGGTIWIDQIELVRDPARPMGFAKAPAPVALPGDKISRIDVGAEADVKDENGHVWMSDRGYYWGRGKSYDDDGGIQYHGPLAEISRTERYGVAGYGFAVPNGAYHVQLLYGEAWAGAMAPKRRVCALTVNGVKQPDVDIFAETKALWKQMFRKVPVDVKDGKIEILFHDVVNHCKIDGIEIVPAALAAQADQL